MSFLRDCKPLSTVKLALNGEIQHWPLCEHHLSWRCLQRCPMGDGPWERVLASSITSLLKAKTVFEPKRIHFIFVVVKIEFIWGREEKEELSLICYAQKILGILSLRSDFEIVVLRVCGGFFFTFCQERRVTTDGPRDGFELWSFRIHIKWLEEMPYEINWVESGWIVLKPIPENGEETMTRTQTWSMQPHLNMLWEEKRSNCSFRSLCHNLVCMPESLMPESYPRLWCQWPGVGPGGSNM